MEIGGALRREEEVTEGTFNPLRYAFRGNGSKCDAKSWGEAETVLGTGGTGEGYAAEGKSERHDTVTE